ncbi:cytochrome P450 [Mycena floridula]|nr:cytochrome P450 [Mycena floridula]
MDFLIYKLAAAFFPLWVFNKLLNIGQREKSLPSGPPTIPILEWAKEYGPIYSLKVGPETAIVISSAATVKELMDKRSASLASRPPCQDEHWFAVTGGLNFVLAPYTEQWRTLRKAAHTILTPQASKRHLPIQEAEATQLMYDLLKDPEAFYKHIRRYSNSVIMSVLFGKRSSRATDVTWKSFLENQDALGLSRELVGYLGATLIEGGSDTTSSFLQSLIDGVIGDERRPTFEDFENLPYIQAIVKEMHRFRPVTPLAIPHANVSVEERDRLSSSTYGVSIMIQPEVFNPDRFLLTKYGTKPGFDASDFRATLSFGTGRRICPGMHLANNSLMLNTMNLIWGFSFSCATDPSTKASIPLDLFNYEKEIMMAPCPFKCAITVRSNARASIIQQGFLDAIPTFTKFEDGI